MNKIIGTKVRDKDEEVETFLLPEEKQFLRREKRLWPTFPLSQSYHDFLRQLTKAELNNIRRTWNVKNVSMLKKDELISVLVGFVSGRIAEVVALFDQERFSLLKKLIQCEGILKVDDDIENVIEYYRKKGIIFTGVRKNQQVVCLPTELISPIRKHICKEMETRVKRNSEWIGLTQGLLYYYGVLSFSKLQEMLEKLTQEPIDSLECNKVLHDAIDYYHQIEYCDAGYCDRLLVEDVERIIMEQQRRPNIDYYPFSKAQLLTAGQLGFINWTPELRNFERVIKQHYDMSKEEIEDIIIIPCIDRIRLDVHLKEILDYLQSVLEVSSSGLLQQLAAAMNKVMNSTCRWILKGHTPNQIACEERKHLRAVPAAPFEVQSPLGHVLDFATRKKVGRNEPCPCGSGKKYKKCCGRNV